MIQQRRTSYTMHYHCPGCGWGLTLDGHFQAMLAAVRAHSLDDHDLAATLDDFARIEIAAITVPSEVNRAAARDAAERELAYQVWSVSEDGPMK